MFLLIEMHLIFYAMIPDPANPITYIFVLFLLPGTIICKIRINVVSLNELLCSQYYIDIVTYHI